MSKRLDKVLEEALRQELESILGVSLFDLKAALPRAKALEEFWEAYNTMRMSPASHKEWQLAERSLMRLIDTLREMDKDYR